MPAPIIAPNFISVRLQEDDKQLYAKVHEALERKIGIRQNSADVYRHAMKQLADALKVK